jgi:hypothetical protein
MDLANRKQQFEKAHRVLVRLLLFVDAAALDDRTRCGIRHDGSSGNVDSDGSLSCARGGGLVRDGHRDSS